jgi:Mg-chelatase subunit ChlD
MQMIERVVTEPVPKPKPRIEPIVDPVVEPELDHPPLVSDPPSPQSVIADAPPVSDLPQISEPISDPQPDQVEFFGQKSIVQRVCYVVDCSGSMYGRMYQVKDQLKKSILNLNSRQAFSIVFFMEGRTILASSGNTLAPATASAKSAALELIETVRPSGSTDAGHALEWSMQLKDASGMEAEVFYFLTDGFDLDPENSRLFAEKVDHLRKAHALGAVLHTIGFDARMQDRQMLRYLAQDTGGSFININ